MTNSALMSSALPWFVLIMTPLLVLFIWTVIRADVEPVDAPSAVAAAETSPLPVRRPPATPPTATAARPGRAGHAAGRAGAMARAQDPARRPEAHPGPPLDPAPAARGAHRRPEVAGNPPWDPAPKPPGLDPWHS